MGVTPLHDACVANHLEIVKLLLEFGAEVNFLNLVSTILKITHFSE